jgi:serine/threonine protein kinase
MARKMFISEARVVANLDHPHIVKIYELSKIGSEIGIIMEYVDGESCSYILDSLRKIGASIPLPVVLTIIVQACEALGYAHRVKSHDGRELNLIHRDIDANNLMLDGRGYLKIIDFGIAKTSLSHDLTMTGQIKGKVNYLCPDILKHKDYDSRVDIYSLGLVFFEMLTMRQPLLAPKGTPFWQLVDLLQSNHLPLPSAINKTLPREIDEIVVKATEKNRNRRYQNAEVFAMDIRRFAKQHCALAPPNIVRAWFLGQFPNRLASRRDLEKEVLTKAREIFADRMAKASTEPTEMDNSVNVDPEKMMKIDDALKPVSEVRIAAWSKSQKRPQSILLGGKGSRVNPYALLTLFFAFFVIGTLMIHQLFFADDPLWTFMSTKKKTATIENNLFVDSLPSNADIYIDGRKIGNTGIAGKMTTLAPYREHKIIILKDKYIPYEIIVQGVPFGQRRIEARLTPVPEQANQFMEFSETEAANTIPDKAAKVAAIPETSTSKSKWRPLPFKKATPAPAHAPQNSTPAPSGPKKDRPDERVLDRVEDGGVRAPENAPPEGGKKETKKPSDETDIPNKSIFPIYPHITPVDSAQPK